jgi:flagellar basal-body rod protein FlgF
MVRGIYTGASGMLAEQTRLDTISNNLANADVEGYKRDVTIEKAFPELLIRRMNDDGVRKNPLGSSDYAPVVGRIGTGVEVNELFTEFEQGSMKQTDNDYDVALDGKGFLTVKTPDGERLTRNGSFTLGKEGYLETKEGFQVLGEKGPIQVKANNFTIDKDGNVFINATFQGDPNRLVSREENTWDKTVLLDRLKIQDVDNSRYLQKQGSSLWRTTEISGDATVMATGRPKIEQGFVEASNVNPVTEMVQMIEVNRAYEANQKSIQTEDAMLNKLLNEVVRVG